MEPVLMFPVVYVALLIFLVLYFVKIFRDESPAKRQQREAKRARKEEHHAPPSPWGPKERDEWLAGAVKRRREALAEKAAREAASTKRRKRAKAHPESFRPATLHNQEQLRRAAASPMKPAGPWPEPPTERATPLEPTTPLSKEDLEELPFSSRAGYSDTMIFTTPPAEPPKAHRFADRVPPAGQPKVNAPEIPPIIGANEPALEAPTPEEPVAQPAQPQRPLHDEHGWHVPTIPGFRRLTPVGSGGMADVFKGEDSTGTLRAVKFLRKSRPGETLEEKLFHREARMLAALTSKSIPRLISKHLDAPRPYFVMEYIDGTDLGTYVKSNGPITGGSVLLDLAHSTTEALGEIHTNNYLHRDIKPSNIMASRRGFKLIDFGIGKDLGSESTSSATRMGTMAFMAPEYMGGKDASRASDVFSWGATLGYAMTGFLPYGPHPEHILMQRVLNGHFDARFLRAVDEIKSRSVTHHMLAYLVGATMRIDPAERDISFRDMILALRKLRPTD